jgi:hypothetical protein
VAIARPAAWLEDGALTLRRRRRPTRAQAPESEGGTLVAVAADVNRPSAVVDGPIAPPRARSCGPAFLPACRLGRIRPRILVAASIAAWLTVLSAGVVLLMRHTYRPGATGTPAREWPVETKLERARDRPTLVVVLHPRCPCSRATIAELDRALARTTDAATVHALLLTPRELADAWGDTDVRRRIAAIPGVRITEDVDGREAARFGAATSGHVLVYDAEGQLAFDGGITAARGHEGDNHGAARLAALLGGRIPTSPLDATPVFGCALGDLAASDGTS